MKCLRCQTKMEFLGSEQIQLGRTGWILGSLSNLFSGALDVGIYICPKCKKIEFFSAFDEQTSNESELPQIICPSCGKPHDFDYPKCPFCNHQY